MKLFRQKGCIYSSSIMVKQTFGKGQA